MKCPINLIFKETESFGFELVSILLIKYCSGKKYYTVVAQKRAQPPWAGFIRIFWWILWVVSMRWWNFFAQKVFIISFGQICLIFLLCFFICIPENIKPDYFYPIFLFSIGVLFLIEGIGWSCLEIMGQDSCFIFLVQLQLQWWVWSASFKSINEIPL